MPEGLNEEFAHMLSEKEEGHAAAKESPWHEALELIEVAILAVVAVATAWSGLQAARWDGRQSLLYGQASSLRFQADAASTLAGQQLSADASMFTAWLQAHAAGNNQLESLMVNRFTPDYAVAFDAWLATDPFTNPHAPSGPAAMPQYHNPNAAKAVTLNAQASDTFNKGTDARDNADRYVRDTVLFAGVLFLIAIAQRFKLLQARIALGTIAGLLLVFVAISVITLPRL